VDLFQTHCDARLFHRTNDNCASHR
jgi:hypothetical protein